MKIVALLCLPKVMQSKLSTPAEYIASLPQERKQVMIDLRKTIVANLPKGFKEEMSYGHIGYIVPLSLYPDGYHCDTSLPLPFLSIASQKNFVALYHMGIYSDKELHDWFVGEYPKHVKTKLDMGKSCIRFKKPEHIPFDLIGELVARMSPEEWIEIYERAFKR
jgi:hypothetical protein